MRTARDYHLVRLTAALDTEPAKWHLVDGDRTACDRPILAEDVTDRSGEGEPVSGLSGLTVCYDCAHSFAGHSTTLGPEGGR